MALRLKYENIPCQTTTHIRPALKRTILRGTGNIYIFVNYSGLRPLQHMLRSWQDKSKKHRRGEMRRPGYHKPFLKILPFNNPENTEEDLP